MPPKKRPLPPQPDIELNAHLSEKERMIASFPYDKNDKQLLKGRARKLSHKYNNAEEEPARQAILAELSSAACKGNKIHIEPPFRVDYGYNITVGKNVYANFGCVILDCAPITIGDNCLLAPNVQLYVNPKYILELSIPNTLKCSNDLFFEKKVEKSVFVI